MSDVSREMTTLFVRELEGFKRELAMFPDDESVWRTVPGVANSAGNLAVHVAGGLQHFVGAVFGRTGYVRNRDAEFGQRSGSRSGIAAELDRAIAVVRGVLPGLTDAQLAASFPEPVMGVSVGTRIFLIHLCAHAGFHLGQAGYLRRALTGEGAGTSGPLPVGPLTSATAD